MKYSVYAPLLMLLSTGVMAQDVATVADSDTLEFTKPRKKYTHWSLELSGGFSNMRGGSRDTANAHLISGQFRPTGSIGLEYTVNPLFGLSAEYTYINYDNWDYKAVSNEGTIVGHVNFSNLLDPNRKAQRLNFYGHIGAGLAAYNYELPPGFAQPPVSKSDITFVMPMGGSVEYNLGKVVALNFKTEYRWHSSTGMLGILPFQPGYGFWQNTLGIRFKFGGARHMKNVTLRDYNWPADSVALESLMEPRLQRMEEFWMRRMAAYQQQHQDDVDALNREIINLQNRIMQMKDSICSLVKDCGLATPPMQLDNVEFAVGSARVTDKYEKYLQALAALIKSNSNWYITVQGHADVTGSEGKNKDLSAQRAAAVKAVLVRYGVPESKISTSHFGSTRPLESNNTDAGRQSNRRTEIMISVR